MTSYVISLLRVVLGLTVLCAAGWALFQLAAMFVPNFSFLGHCARVGAALGLVWVGSIILDGRPKG